jgi:hypothetical protein
VFDWMSCRQLRLTATHFCLCNKRVAALEKRVIFYNFMFEALKLKKATLLFIAMRFEPACVKTNFRYDGSDFSA